MPRTNLSDQFDATQRKEWKPKIVCRNTFKFERDGATVYRLHGTDIVWIRDGKTTLNSAGWKTVTTKDRMSHYSGYNVYSKNGCWYVAGRGSWNDIPYFDGMVLPDAFKAPAKGVATEKREIKLRADIKKFVAKLDKLFELPAPSQGDCWYCSTCVVDGKNAGKSMGELSHSDHIASHVKEGYLHGSLILNALKWAGYPYPGIVWQMGNSDLARGKKPGMIKRALKRYLYRQFGLVG